MAQVGVELVDHRTDGAAKPAGEGHGEGDHLTGCEGLEFGLGAGQGGPGLKEWDEATPFGQGEFVAGVGEMTKEVETAGFADP